MDMDVHEPQQQPELFDRIEQILTECRVVVPGAQALLGFQLIAIFTDGFAKLTKSSQYVHFGALLFIGLSMILLMTPAAYHRIVEAGEASEQKKFKLLGLHGPAKAESHARGGIKHFLRLGRKKLTKPKNTR